MEIKQFIESNIYIIQLKGSFDHLTHTEALNNALQKSRGHKTVQIDMAEVDFIGSIFTNTLIVFRNQHPTDADNITIHNTPESIIEIIKTVSLDKVYSFIL